MNRQMKIPASKNDKEIKTRLGCNYVQLMRFYERFVKHNTENLSNAKSVLLLGLGLSYWYANRLKSEFPNIENVYVLPSEWEGEEYEQFAEENRFFKVIDDECPNFVVSRAKKDKDGASIFGETLRTMLSLRYMNKFDSVIANPPFNLGRSATQLHLQIIDAVLTSGCLTDNAKVVSIQPVNWLLKPVDRAFNKGAYNTFSALRSHITDVEFVKRETANKVFGIDIINPLAIYTFSAKANDNWDEQAFYEQHARVDKTSFFKKVVYRCHAKEVESFNDVMLPHKRYGKFHCFVANVYGAPKDDPYALMSPSYDNIRGDGKRSNGKDKDNPVINFDSEEEAENFRHSTDTPFYKYINWCYKVNIRQCQNKYPWLGNAVNPRTGIVGYKGEWTDDDLFDYFNISLEEREMARENLRKSIEENI